MKSEDLGQRISPVSIRPGREVQPKTSGLARSHTGCGMDPGLFLGAHTLSSWILMISKPPPYLHVLPQDTKPYGTTVAELATALFLILSQHLQNPFPWLPLRPLQLGQLRNSRGRRWGSSVICHEDVPLARWRDALSNPCSASLSTKCLWGSNVLPTQRSHHGTAFPNMLPTASLCLSPSPFCFLHSPYPSLGVTSPHPYFHALLLLMSSCPSCVALPQVELSVLSCIILAAGGPQLGQSWKRKEVQLLPLGVGSDGMGRSSMVTCHPCRICIFLHPGAAAGWTSTAAGMPSTQGIGPSVSRLWALLVWARFPTVFCKPSGST